MVRLFVEIEAEGVRPLQIRRSTELQLPSCLVRLRRFLVIEAHGFLQSILADGMEVSRNNPVKLGSIDRAGYRLRQRRKREQ